MTTEQLAQLEEAKRIIENAMKTMVVSERTCHTCERVTYDDFHLYNDKKILEGVVNRLNRLTNPARWHRDNHAPLTDLPEQHRTMSQDLNP